jgi:nucleotide-binding universal stress UspA family protein
MLSGMPKRIVVPLDGTPLGEAVLPDVAELARALGAAIELLHVVPPSFVRGTKSAQSRRREMPQQMMGAPSVLPAYSPSSTVLAYKYDQSEVESNRRYVERVAAWLRDEGLEAVAVVAEGPDVATEVLRHLASADMLALAAGDEPGGSRFGRLVFGSISERLIHESHKPVFLVRVPHAQG